MSAVNGLNSVNISNIQGMDLETAMMAVQSSRANALEGQLKSQMDGVQSRNAQIGKLNDVLGALNRAAATFPGDAKADTKLGSGAGTPQLAAEMSVNDTMKSANLTGVFDTKNNGGLTSDGQRAGNGSLDSTVTKSQLDAAISTVKSQIDAQSNSQQMDMLRMQSLSNKRNEAFDLMTNFVKKMADARSSVIGNMR